MVNEELHSNGIGILGANSAAAFHDTAHGVREGSAAAVLRGLEAGFVQTCVTSPPYYGLRDYGIAGQIGQEPTLDEYVAALVEVFREVRRVLRDDGTLWLNLGDSYAGAAKTGAFRPGSGRADGEVDERGQRNRNGTPCPPGCKPKDLIGVPWRVAFALQADGWYLRSSIIWMKGNPMPEPVSDRPTNCYENVFLLTKQDRYLYNAEAIAEPEAGGLGRRDGGGGRRNARNVWSINPKPYKGAHFATMPVALAERCILAGSRVGDTVIDPFGGAGTTSVAAKRLGRNSMIAELNPEYAAMARTRINKETPEPWLFDLSDLFRDPPRGPPLPFEEERRATE